MRGTRFSSFISLLLMLSLFSLSGCGQNTSEATSEIPATSAETLSVSVETTVPADAAADSVSADPVCVDLVPASRIQESSSTVEEQILAGPYSFSLGFAGDINFADNYIPMQHLTSIESTSISDGIDPRYIDLMQSMDLMWINNEFVYSDRGEPLYGKMWTFRSAPEHVSYMHDLGVDIVGLANNHCYDYGEDAFLDTLTTLEDAGIPYVGGGRTLDDVMAPVYLETNGFTIAYVAASNCEYTIYTPEATEDSPGILWCYEWDRFLEAIRTADANADFVVALPHWGTEHSTELTWDQTEGAHACIDAGADAVIGAHPHILQGIEYYNEKPILYSLGNFWFDDYYIDTMVAELRFTGTRNENGTASLDDADLNVVLHPGTQFGIYTHWADTEEWREQIFDHLEAISGYAIEIDSDGVLHDASEEVTVAA